MDQWHSYKVTCKKRQSFGIGTAAWYLRLERQSYIPLAINILPVVSKGEDEPDVVVGSCVYDVIQGSKGSLIVDSCKIAFNV